MSQGKDDMRMDERLMQLVRLADTLMGAEAETARRELHARSFSMTPLGPRLGLVQWVDHTIPLFQVRILPPALRGSVPAQRDHTSASCSCWSAKA